MAFSLYKSWNRLCEIDAYECTYFSEQTINGEFYFILDICQVIIHMTQENCHLLATVFDGSRDSYFILKFD